MQRTISIFAAITITAAVVGFGLLGTSSAFAAASPPEIQYPTNGSVVDAGVVTIRAALTSTSSAEQVTAMYVVDVSGSTGLTSFDCSGDGLINIADDLNSDGVAGETLDCEIAATIALNTSLAAIPGSNDRIRAGLVAFGDLAAIADLDIAAGDQSFVSLLADTDGDRNRAADIVQVASSLDQSVVRLYTSKSVGFGTNFDPALQTAVTALSSRPGRRIVFLLTDGQGRLSESTLTAARLAGVEIRPFGVTSGSDRCAPSGALARIAASSGTQCVYVENPASLSAVVTGQPSSVQRVDVQLDSGPIVAAAVDPLGNIQANVNVPAGNHTVSVTVRYTDGTSAVSTVSFRATEGVGYVAMGDSYSAGEGILPFLPVPGAKNGCHQSEKSYSRLVGTPGLVLPGNPNINFDFVACSGAVLKNLLSVPQNARGETHIVQTSRVGTEADLVTFTIGGNDMGFSAIATHCALQVWCYNDDFASLTTGKSVPLEDFVEIRLALLRPELQTFYRTLRTKTANNAMIVALDYPEVMDDGIAVRIGCKERLIFDRAESQFINGFVNQLSGAIEQGASAAGIWSASVIPKFKGHRICDGGINTQSEWLVGHETAKKAAGDASFHPDDTGARAYAEVLTEFVQSRLNQGGPVTPQGLPRNPDPTAPQAVASSPANVGFARGFAPFQTATPLPATGLTDAEIAEVAAITFSDGDIEGLSARRGSSTCSENAALGEQLVVTGYGFAPNSSVSFQLKSESEINPRTSPVPLTANADGGVTASFIVPQNLGRSRALAGTDAWALLGVLMNGRNGDGGQHRVSDALFIELPGSLCTATITAAGDVSTGSEAAPSAALTPGVPPLQVLPVVALFTTGTGGIEFNGAQHTVNALVHSNGPLAVKGNSVVMSGGAEYATSLEVKGSAHAIAPAAKLVPSRGADRPIDARLLAPGSALAQSLGAAYYFVSAGDCKNGTWKPKASELTEGVWYVDCAVELNLSPAVDLTIVATGTVKIASSQLRFNAYLPGVAVVSTSAAENAVEISGANNLFSGEIATNGGVRISGSSGVFACGLTAASIRVAGSSHRFETTCRL